MNKTVLLAALPLAMAALSAWPLTAQAKPAKAPMKAKAPTKAKAAPSAVGDWSGALNAGGTQLRLVVHFTPKPGGGLAGTMDSLDQGANGIPFSLVRQTGGKVHAEASGIHAVYDGALDSTGKTIVGRWVQSVPLPLTLTRMTAVMRAAQGREDRPQEPKPPYPYAASDAEFPGGAAGVTLAGTLTIPAGDGPFPAAVLISGSGPNDRDETILRHKLFLVLADSLTRRGIAVLRYDKRGAGKSTGSYALATSADFAEDARAAFAYLKAQPQVNPAKIGLIGHSEGGLIAPMVAAKSRDVAFLVLLAGTGFSGERIIAEQAALIGKAEGASDADVAKSQVTEKAVLAVAVHEPNADAARIKIEALMRQAFAAATPAQKKAAGDPTLLIRAQSAAIVSPWFRYFLTYDPAPTLKQVHCPVLALDGSLDLQVPPAENLAAIGTALKAGGNTDVTTTELPGLNHLFQTAHTGSPSEYGKIEETLSPTLLKVVGDWVEKVSDPLPGASAGERIRRDQKENHMPLVFACIAPHGGHLLLPLGAPGPVPECRRAMAALCESLRAARPDCVAILTPHGVGIEGAVSLGVTAMGYGELDGEGGADKITVTVETDLDLAASWAYRATERGVPVAPLSATETGGALPLDWGVTIPLALLTPGAEALPTVVACPARTLSRTQLVDLGESLVEAGDALGRRVALIVSADQGHGHAADGPYGFTPASAEYDASMRAAIEADDLRRLLDWPADYAETALADSYWQTLALIGAGKRIPLHAQFLAYEVDHYFGLLCAGFAVG